MPTKSARTLLIEAPQNRHFCQIHREPQLLAATIGLFVESGLKRGERVLVVASGSQRSALVEKITAAGMDAATLQAALDAGPVVVSGAAVERVATNSLLMLVSAAETARRNGFAIAVTGLSAPMLTPTRPRTKANSPICHNPSPTASGTTFR